MNFNKKKYDKLVPLFEKYDNNCAKIAFETHTEHATVLKYFSIYLREKMKNSRYIELKEGEIEAPRCPTCRRLKNEVKEVAICRDVFHYL